eukprot:Gb_40972 [translate_table: standard]
MAMDRSKSGSSNQHEEEEQNKIHVRDQEDMEGFIELWKRMFGFMDSLGLRWAVEMGIPDIISKSGPQSAQQIASHLPSESPQIDFISRILRFLAMRGVFTETVGEEEKEIRYGLTPISKWLLTENSDCMNSMILVQTHEKDIAPWYFFGQCVLRGGFPFEMAHGKRRFSFTKDDPDFNKLFNDSMASYSRMLINNILTTYGDGFKRLKSLVDVGGGDGTTISKIAQSFPHIKCYNYDLPQVIQDAPPYPGVEHIAGDMFISVPHADTIFMKTVLHDWGDEECKKILKNCRQAIGQEDGHVIIVDAVLREAGKKRSGFDEIGVMMDMVMLSHQRGKERSESRWKELLEASGFDRHNIIPLPNSQMSIIEAFPSISFS